MMSTKACSLYHLLYMFRSLSSSDNSNQSNFYLHLTTAFVQSLSSYNNNICLIFVNQHLMIWRRVTMSNDHRLIQVSIKAMQVSVSYAVLSSTTHQIQQASSRSLKKKSSTQVIPIRNTTPSLRPARPIPLRRCRYTYRGTTSALPDARISFAAMTVR